MRPFLTIIRVPWNWLTKPSNKIQSKSERRRARLLSALLLALIIFFAAASWLTSNSGEVLMLRIMCLSALLLYGVSRTRFHLFAAFFSVTGFTLFMFGVLEGAHEYSEIHLINELKWMSLPLLFGCLCLPFRIMLPFSLVTIIIMSQIQRFLPINPDFILTESISFIGIVSSLGLVATAILNRQQKDLEAEHQKSDRLLLNILPQPIAEQLKQNGEVRARNFADASILFADIVGFTALSARTDAFELVNLLNHIFSEFDGIAEKYGLEKIKTIGDAYMAAGGLPVPEPDNCLSMAKMALEMRTVMKMIALEEKLDLDVRIGIHTGPVVAGVIGKKKFIYDVWGDTVNMASRMESLSLPGKIQITKEVSAKLDTHFQIEKRGEISVKGKGNIVTFFLEGEKN